VAIRTFEILGTGNYYLRTIYIFLYVSLQNAKRIHRTSQIRGTSLTEYRYQDPIVIPAQKNSRR